MARGGRPSLSDRGHLTTVSNLDFARHAVTMVGLYGKRCRKQRKSASPARFLRYLKIYKKWVCRDLSGEASAEHNGEQAQQGAGCAQPRISTGGHCAVLFGKFLACRMSDMVLQIPK